MSANNKFRTLISNLSVIKEYYNITTRHLIAVHKALLSHPAFIFLHNLVFSSRILSRKNPVVNYFFKLIGTIVEAAVLIAASGILCLLIFYCLDMLWYLYLGTPMGEKFISQNPEKAQTIILLTELDLFYFCAELTLSAFAICFGAGSICRFLHISHYLYLSQGLFGKLVYWGIPLTGAVSCYIKSEFGLSDWNVNGFIVMIPTYLLFFSCFKYAEKLIPEIGDVIKILTPWVRHAYQLIYARVTNLTRNIMNQ